MRGGPFFMRWGTQGVFPAEPVCESQSFLLVGVRGVLQLEWIFRGENHLPVSMSATTPLLLFHVV